MLKLQRIVKDYQAGDTTVHALRGVSLQFRESEFVAILGHSGCGKTTLLNIIGGLDQYTSGDLIIKGQSTKKFKSGDWDTYRNHSIGFVFQSYNLIPHLTVLGNVELALTLAGISSKERKQRAMAVLERVGLKNEYKKRPNQLSGGQMQRVAIARALVNNPEILLADEPTGALDSKTSVQIMELIKEISKESLVKLIKEHYPAIREAGANELAEVFLELHTKCKNGEISSKALDLRGLIGSIGMMEKGLNIYTALDMGITNKSFDEYEQTLIRDTIRARISRKMSGEQLFC